MANPRKPRLEIEVEWDKENNEALVLQLGRALARMAAREDDERENGPLDGPIQNGEVPLPPYKRGERRKVQS